LFHTKLQIDLLSCKGSAKGYQIPHQVNLAYVEFASLLIRALALPEAGSLYYWRYNRNRKINLIYRLRWVCMLTGWTQEGINPKSSPHASISDEFRRAGKVFIAFRRQRSSCRWK